MAAVSAAAEARSEEYRKMFADDDRKREFTEEAAALRDKRAAEDSARSVPIAVAKRHWHAKAGEVRHFVSLLGLHCGSVPAWCQCRRRQRW